MIHAMTSLEATDDTRLPAHIIQGLGLNEHGKSWCSLFDASTK